MIAAELRRQALALRLARRELRGGVRGFRLFMACLTLGVMTIAGIGAITEAVQTGLRQDSRLLLGADVELELTQRSASAEELGYLAAAGRLSAVTTMRAMARTVAGRSTLVELKAVDGAYPLYGALTLDPARPGSEAFGADGGGFGVAADPDLLVRLGLRVGDPVIVGEARFLVRGAIVAEPDRSASGFQLGPRLLIGMDGLAAAGLLRKGSLIRHGYRLALSPERDLAAWIEQTKKRFPEAGWRIRDYRDGPAEIRSFVMRFGLFLTLAGLAALLVGGVGVANAVKAHLDAKTAAIAILKCVGAPAGLIFRIYLWQVLALALAGILIGLALGALAPLAVSRALAGDLPVALGFGIYLKPLGLAALFGLLTALAFALWPLARACELPAAALFRDAVSPARRWPRPSFLLAIVLTFAALAGLAVVSAADRALALWFVGGAVASFAAFRAAAWLLMVAARAVGRPRQPHLRLALANLYRPGTPTPAVMLSFGLGLTLLTAIALIEANLVRQVSERLPAAAPSFFFVDIQSDQIAGFDAIVAATPGVQGFTRVPSLRGRIMAINGVPVDAAQAKVAPNARWALGSDRGVTYAAEPPEGARVVAGTWWRADHSGPPLLSFDADLAQGFGLAIGDRLTVNVLGRDIDATIASLRAIDWGTLGLNFTLLFDPATLAAAPHTYIATVRVPAEEEERLQRAVTGRFGNITAIRMSEALAAVENLLRRISLAVDATAAVALASGALVLAGAIAAEHRRRTCQAVVLKVLGAERKDILAAQLIEHGLTGLAAGAIALGLGSVAAWVVVVQVMAADWLFAVRPAALTLVGGMAIAVLFGLLGSLRALGHKAATALREATQS
ncbi:MAG: FtsX-like permease family protein [Alphaproteobacteria bacterium]|nr:FtsX-like permease family protein [Alphaproteobacteria bacterium]